MSSGSVSESASESCCFPSSCACDTWLTAFCDYETVTLDYCGEQTQFDYARSDDVPITVVNPQSGVMPADKIFRISMTENTVEVGIGGTITDSDGTEWVIYKVETLRAFCVKKLWTRSVAACFGLLDKIDVLEQDCECTDCGTKIQYKRVARIKGKIIAETATRRSQNDAADLVYQFEGQLIKWPLATRPSANNRLKDKSGVFRIVNVRDHGPLAPFMLKLEIDGADCSVR